MDRLREVIVCAGLDAVDAIRQLGLTRDENDWRQSCRRIGLQLPADFQAVDQRHGHVEEDDVRSVSVNGSESGCAVGSEHHIVTVGAEEAMKEGADALPVIGDQHAAAQPPLSAGTENGPSGREAAIGSGRASAKP